MQHAVERDEQSNSTYVMCAVNPGRIGKTIDDAALREVIATISKVRLFLIDRKVQCQSPSSISHVGIQLLICCQGQQYDYAGELVTFQVLMNVLSYFKVQHIDITKVWSLDNSLRLY
jgi:fatty acid synthase subunit alpha